VTIITGGIRETTYLCHQFSVALQKGNTVLFQNTFAAGKPVATSYLLFLTFIFSVHSFVFAGHKNNKSSAIHFGFNTRELCFCQ